MRLCRACGTREPLPSTQQQSVELMQRRSPCELKKRVPSTRTVPDKQACLGLYIHAVPSSKVSGRFGKLAALQWLVTTTKQTTNESSPPQLDSATSVISLEKSWRSS